MSEGQRYVSRDLSRLLANAGLQQSFSGEYWHQNQPPMFMAHWEDTESDSVGFRALDMTDCIYELTRHRSEEKNTVPLCVGYALDTYGEETLKHTFTAYGPFVDDSRRAEIETSDVSDVEACALVLLTLLKERKLENDNE